MRALNRQRASILFSHLIEKGSILSPLNVASKERILEKPGLLRWLGHETIGRAVIGARLQDILIDLGSFNNATGASKVPRNDFIGLLQTFGDTNYIMWLDARTSSAIIALKKGAVARDHLMAWAHALLAVRELQDMLKGSIPTNDDMMQLLHRTKREVQALLEKNWNGIQQAGWNLEATSLEVHSGSRLTLESHAYRKG